MWTKHRSSKRPPTSRGFALVAALMLMILLAVLAVGMMGLAAIELRRSSQGENMAMARANARLALIQAIGQLQRTLGPDQRVSATAEILPGELKQPHWTGAWRSTREDGAPWFTRDGLSGGLRDARVEDPGRAGDRVIEWLVSGTGNPASGPSGPSITLGRDETGRLIEVPRVVLRRADGVVSGHQAWWTGDLGVRSNLATADAWKEKSSADDLARWFRVMTSQAADHTAMAGGKTVSDDEITRLASAGTSALSAAGKPWAANHVFNTTVDSQAVLADTLNGGLKRDLTAFIASGGSVPAFKGIPGLRQSDPLIAHLESSAANPRVSRISPRFGLLRDWARLGAPMSGRNVTARLAQTDPAAGRSSASLALANEFPVKLDGNTVAGLQPILVEATNYIHLSTFRLGAFNPPQFQLRHHHYPRVVLWNPYNVELEFDRSIIMIQGNGRQEMWTENEHYDKNGKATGFRSMGQWLSFEGGRSTSFNSAGKGIMATEGYNDPYLGSYYFAIPRTRFGPGECLVFSPARQAEYDCLSPYRPGAYNLNPTFATEQVFEFLMPVVVWFRGKGLHYAGVALS